MEEAIIARNNAYTYSKFKVGAALLRKQRSCNYSNQENAAYPSDYVQKQ
jgi:cytidine deaminase